MLLFIDLLFLFFFTLLDHSLVKFFITRLPVFILLTLNISRSLSLGLIPLHQLSVSFYIRACISYKIIKITKYVCFIVDVFFSPKGSIVYITLLDVSLDLLRFPDLSQHLCGITRVLTPFCLRRIKGSRVFFLHASQDILPHLPDDIISGFPVKALFIEKSFPRIHI